MKIEAAELKEHLTEYLVQIRSSGEIFTVCDHGEPVATLAPVPKASDERSGNLIDRLLANPAPIKDFQPLTREEIYERE